MSAQRDHCLLCLLRRASLCCVVCLSLSSPLSELRFYSYLLSLMILTVGQSIMVPIINPSLPLFLFPLSFSVTVWQCEICSPSGYKSTFILRNVRCESTRSCMCQYKAGYLMDAHVHKLPHAKMQLRNGIVMERWIRFIAGSEVAINAKSGGQGKWDRNTIRWRGKRENQKDGWVTVEWKDEVGGRHVNRNKTAKMETESRRHGRYWG